MRVARQHPRIFMSCNGGYLYDDERGHGLTVELIRVAGWSVDSAIHEGAGRKRNRSAAF